MCLLGYLHTSFAILLSEVALHVHNTSKYAFFCKHVNHENVPASLRKQKKKGFTGARTLNLGLEPSTLLSDALSTTVILNAPPNRL